LVFTEFGQNIKMLLIFIVAGYLYILKCYKEKLGISSKYASFIIIMLFIFL